MHLYVFSFFWRVRVANTRAGRQCRVRTLDIRLVLTETAAGTASGTATSVVRPGEEAQLQRERDRQREAWEEDMRCMGRLLRGLEVRIVRKHQEKALYGTIVDYRHIKSEPAVDTVSRSREDMGNSIDSILADVQLQIRLENGDRQATVTSAQVVERSYVHQPVLVFLPLISASALVSPSRLPRFSRSRNCSICLHRPRIRAISRYRQSAKQTWRGESPLPPNFTRCPRSSLCPTLVSFIS